MVRAKRIRKDAETKRSAVEASVAPGGNGGGAGAKADTDEASNAAASRRASDEEDEHDSGNDSDGTNATGNVSDCEVRSEQMASQCRALAHTHTTPQNEPQSTCFSQSWLFARQATSPLTLRCFWIAFLLNRPTCRQRGNSVTEKPDTSRAPAERKQTFYAHSRKRKALPMMSCRRRLTS